MCTVSWFHTGAGYHLLSNRDEKKTRSLALPPAIDGRRGVRFIAPMDGDCGGTWIGVNEFALSVCLVNGSPVPAQRGTSLSRGLVVAELLDSRSISEALQRLHAADLSDVAP